MKFKKICLSTQLDKLYGKDNYQSHIKVGKEYWWCFFDEKDVTPGWHKIKITYLRSGIAFYVVTDVPEYAERSFALGSLMAATLVPAELDPIRDLTEEFKDSSMARKLYYFDPTYTVVSNWSNEDEIEIEETDESYPYFLIMTEKIQDP
jgi:hypothetical protein